MTLGDKEVFRWCRGFDGDMVAEVLVWMVG